MDWFLYDRGLRYERIIEVKVSYSKIICDPPSRNVPAIRANFGPTVGI